MWAGGLTHMTGIWRMSLLPCRHRPTCTCPGIAPPLLTIRQKQRPLCWARYFFPARPWPFWPRASLKSQRSQGRYARAASEKLRRLGRTSLLRSGYAGSRWPAGLGKERSRQSRHSQLLKMLVMLLFHFHELCCNPRDRHCRAHASGLQPIPFLLVRNRK